jgi:hypothetical protein
MNNAATHADKVIAAATVPDTDVQITITRRAVRRSETSQCLTATYVVTRKPNGAPFVNYLSCGRDSLTEARAEANFLWSDTVTRRDDVRNRTCALCGEEWADAATAVRCERDHITNV